MSNIIFIIIAIILGSLVFYLTVKKKTKCPHCQNSDVSLTGQKRYKEDPVSIQGSPNSYHELEYKCNKCSKTFWAPKGAVIFN
jgi:hypothetical protein